MFIYIKITQNQRILLALIDPYTGPWGFEQAKHLAKRVLFGSRFGEIKQFAESGLSPSLQNVLFSSSNLKNYPINIYASRGEDTDVPWGAVWLNAPYKATFNLTRIYSFYFWWLARMVEQESTIHEKMILFWHNHFGVSHSMSIDARANFKYYELLRKYATGNFKELVKGMTVNPLMLNFLNGYQNTSRFPDENYARELMELFTLGKGPESKYTEPDVREAAKILTGWVHDYSNGDSVFFYNRHNADDKQFSSFFNNKKIIGVARGEDWPLEINALIDMIFEKEEVSKYICRRLYRFFVHYDITQQIEDEIISPLAATFRGNNYEILPVLSQLLSCQHFYSAEVVGTMIKSPVDFYIGMLREMQVPIVDDIEYKSYFYAHARQVLYDLQQNVPDPPSVAGWPAYYQHPIYSKYWINSETLKNRSKIIDNYIGNSEELKNIRVDIDLAKYTRSIIDAGDPNKLIDNFIAFTFSFEPTEEFKAELKKILLTNQDNDSYWTMAWSDYLAKPNDSVAHQTVENRLKAFYKAILQTKEYNLH